MLSLRVIARSAPRSVTRLASRPVRSNPLFLRSAQKAQVSWTPITRIAAANFCSSSRRLDDQPNNDELIAKLDSEIRVESASEEPSDSFQQYLEDSGFQLHDSPGSQEVRLTKTFGDEHIEISFSVADISAMTDSQMSDPDSAYGDEYDEANEPPSRDMDGQSGGATTNGAVNVGRTSGGNLRVEPEDRVAPADRPELEDEEGYGEEHVSAQNFPVRLLVKVTRDGQQGALEIEATATDGDIMVENVFFYPTAELADPKTGEGEFKRRLVYGGPRYDNLDPDLQGLMDQFLAERGLNATLSQWLPDFVDWKEQREYVRWLNNVKNFLS